MWITATRERRPHDPPTEGNRKGEGGGNGAIPPPIVPFWSCWVSICTMARFRDPHVIRESVMKRWMLPLLLGLAVLSRAEQQIDFDPNLFTGSATPVAVYANIGFAAPGTPYLAQDLSGPFRCTGDVPRGVAIRPYHHLGHADPELHDRLWLRYPGENACAVLHLVLPRGGQSSRRAGSVRSDALRHPQPAAHRVRPWSARQTAIWR
jgi:hypothetical protein